MCSHAQVRCCIQGGASDPIRSVPIRSDPFRSGLADLAFRCKIPDMITRDTLVRLHRLCCGTLRCCLLSEATNGFGTSMDHPSIHPSIHRCFHAVTARYPSEKNKNACFGERYGAPARGRLPDDASGMRGFDVTVHCKKLRRALVKAWKAGKEKKPPIEPCVYTYA